MTTFTIERSYLVPVYEHVIIEAADVAAACAAALDEDALPWNNDEVDYESAQATTITGAWVGKPYESNCLVNPPPAPPAAARHSFACPHCGGTDVTWDAVTRWDVPTQANVIVTLLDSGSCETCACEIKQADEVAVDADGHPIADIESAPLPA